MAEQTGDMIVGIGVQKRYGLPVVPEDMNYVRVPAGISASPLSLEVTSTNAPRGMKASGNTDVHDLSITVPYTPQQADLWNRLAHLDEKKQTPWVTVEVLYPNASSLYYQDPPGRRWHSAKLGHRSLEVGPGGPALLHVGFTSSFCDVAQFPHHTLMPEYLPYSLDEATLREWVTYTGPSEVPVDYLHVGETFVLRDPRGRKPLWNIGESLWAVEFVTSETRWSLMESTACGAPLEITIVCERNSMRSQIRLPQAKVVKCSTFTDDDDIGPQMIVNAIGRKPDPNTVAGTWE